MADIYTKISKIIAKADSTTSPEEAETFMAKAQQLMMEHGISLLDVGRLDADDPVGVTEEAADYSSSERWAALLGGRLARYYGCEAIIEQVARSRFAFGVAGRQSARVTFMLMFPFIVKQVRSIAREEVKAGNFSSVARAKTAIANALAIRLYKLNNEQEKETVRPKRCRSSCR